MQTYLKHQKILVAPTALWWRWKTPAAIFFNANYFDTKKCARSAVFIPGVDRAGEIRFFAFNAREVVEDGFAGGPVIPADFFGPRIWARNRAR